MPTKSSNRDALVLDAVQRTGLGVRELLRQALGGTDPNNVLHRLIAKRHIRSVQGALPHNRAYYLPRGENTLGAVALNQRLAVSWFTQVPSASKAQRIPLQRDELKRIFAEQAPPGTHVLQSGPKDRPRILLCYSPDTELVGEGILRVLARARTFPKIAKAIRSKDYGIAVLVPWNSGLAPKLRRALAGNLVPGLKALSGGEPLSASVHFCVERVATPLTLSQAIKELGT